MVDGAALEYRRLSIRGKVQGVYYRASMVDEARRWGAQGWVRNRLDGSVEALVAGDGETVARLIAWARVGPDAAVVEQVLVEEASAADLEDAAGEFRQVATA